MKLTTRTQEQISNYHQLKRDMLNEAIYDNIAFANLQISAYNGDPLNLHSFTDSDLKFLFTHKDVNGMTPLHYAWYNGHYKTAFEICSHLELKKIGLVSAHYDILPMIKLFKLYNTISKVSSTTYNFLSTCYNSCYNTSRTYLANLSGIHKDTFSQKERAKIDFFSIGF